MEEIWEDIENFNGIYQISTLGRVRSKYARNNHITKGRINKDYKVLKPVFRNGYPNYNLRNEKGSKLYKVHRLLALHFIPNPENKPCINHIDGDRTNSVIDNLEWVTYSENALHALRIGLAPDLRKKTLMIDKVTGEIIKEFASVTEASKYINKKETASIIKCCNNQRKTAYGYKWKYKNER